MHDWINGSKSRESTKSKARMDMALSHKSELSSLSTMNQKFKNLLQSPHESLSDPLFENMFQRA